MLVKRIVKIGLFASVCFLSGIIFDCYQDIKLIEKAYEKGTITKEEYDKIMNEVLAND